MDFTPALGRLYGRPVTPLDVVTLKGDASSRRYHRLVLPAGLPEPTLVAMELPEDATRSDELTAGAPPPELPFLTVQRDFLARGLRVPAVRLAAVAERLILLEDLGDETLERRLLASEPAGRERWYEAAVDLLAAMHDAWREIPAGCLAATRAFDVTLLRSELDHYREWGLEAWTGRVLPAPLRAALDAEFDALAADLAALPTGFVHRDYQSRNLMVLGAEPTDANLAIIDFQDALTGPRVYDLVALLADSYLDRSDDLVERLAQRYARRRGLDAGPVLAELHLVAVQRKLKDGGRFVFIDRVRHNPSFLPHVELSFALVRRHLARLPDRARLAELLAAADPRRFGPDAPAASAG